MSAINGFRIVGICYQDTVIKVTKNSQKIAYCVLKILNSENKKVPIIAFNETAVRLDYFGKKGNLLQISGTINTSEKLTSDSTLQLHVDLVANEISIINLAKREKLSDRDFSDLFKLYELPKFIPSLKEVKKSGN